MRKSHIDGLHTLVSQHFFVAAIAMWNTPSVTKCIGGSLGAAPNGNERFRLRLLHPIGKDVSNSFRPNDVPGKCSTLANLFLCPVPGVGFIDTSIGHHRLEGSDTIPIREEGTSAAVILITRLLRHRLWPGIGQFAPKAIITKQHVGDAFAFS
jgi:hypothetical protein